MKKITTIGLVLVGILAMYLIAMQSIDRTNRIDYIGTCVSTIAHREGFHGTPEEKWHAFYQYCDNRYYESK